MASMLRVSLRVGKLGVHQCCQTELQGGIRLTELHAGLQVAQSVCQTGWALEGCKTCWTPGNQCSRVSQAGWAWGGHQVDWKWAPGRLSSRGHKAKHHTLVFRVWVCCELWQKMNSVFLKTFLQDNKGRGPNWHKWVGEWGATKAFLPSGMLPILTLKIVRQGILAS